MTIAIDPVMRRRVVWSSTVGNALEWFDFTVFGLFAPVIGKQFFPKEDASAQLLAAYGLMGVAYFARPIGGLFFGAWADRVGRKRALITIVLSMAVGTAAIGATPNFATIGFAAPVVLLLARLLQGFSAGGEFGASTAMLVEFAPPNRKGLYASFQFVAQAVAFFIGAAFALGLTKTLSPEALSAWGWRVPFLAGIIIAPIGFYLRSAIDETPEFKAFLAARQGVPNTPLRDVASRYPRELVALFLMISGLTAYTYMGNIFLTNFASSTLKLPVADAQLGVLVVNFGVAVLMPLAGLAGDVFGRRRVIAPATFLLAVLFLFLSYRLVSEPSSVALWRTQASGLLAVFFIGPFAALALETFPVNVRSTGASIIYNFGVAIFGGLSPTITTALATWTGSNFSPFLYLGGCLALTIVGLAILPKREQT